MYFKIDNPLVVWVLSILLFLSINASLYFFFSFTDGQKLQTIFYSPYAKRIDVTLSNLKRDRMIRREEKFYAVIGSSLTQNGIWCEKEFYGRYGLNGKGINIYPFYWPGHQLQFFDEYFHLFDSLIEIQIDGILIESDLLHYKHQRSYAIESPIITRQQGYLKAFKIYLFNLNKTLPCVNPIDYQLIDTTNFNRLYKEIKTLDDFKYFHPVLRKLNESGIEINTLDIPRPYEVEKTYKIMALDTIRYRLIQLLNNRFGVEHIGFERNLDYALFMDQGHLNRSGQALYSEWLYSTLVDKTPN